MPREYVATDMVPYATLATERCCHLKLDTGDVRVFLCRIGGGVTVKRLDNGRWAIFSGSCVARFAAAPDPTMAVATCPVCHLPGHASETDDLGRHPLCATTS